MTDDARKQEQEEQVQEAPQAENQAEAPDEAGTTRNKGSFISRWGWIFILLIAVGVGLLLTPADVRQKWFANGVETVKESMPQQAERPSEIAPPVTKPATPEKNVTPQTAVKQPVTAPEKKPAIPPAPVTRPAVTITSKPVIRPATSVVERSGISEGEAKQLLDAMNGLQQELSTLRSEQQSLRQTQTELQRIQLRTRLRWIANPVNHLPQIELAWEEISRMPTLSADERQRAQTMYALAHQRHADIRRWQQALNEAAARLRPAEHKNIVPLPEHPWLKWLFGQFSLKRAPGKESQRMHQLQRQLQGTARGLQLEQWPDPLAWQKLRARVQLELAEQPGSDIDKLPKLPENFSDIAHDIGQLRQVAQNWQEQL